MRCKPCPIWVKPAALALAVWIVALAQVPQAAVTSGRRYPRIIVRNAIVIEGNGTPAAGPKDIVIQNGEIADIVAIDPGAMKKPESKRPEGGVEIDAAGKYVMPGLINLHGHVQEERGGIRQPLDYELKLWLACGITTVRDVGSELDRTLALRRESAEGAVAAPRIFVYPFFNKAPAPHNAAEARGRVREIKAKGADGIKILDIYRDVMEAMEAEAHNLGLRVAHHAGVAETNAWDDIRFGTTSIEHWYGIPDAALENGVQNFPPGYNYNNEADRFRYAGRLWREANWERLMKVLDAMVAAHVAWDPTLEIYEASRDLERAQTQPWFADYLHPALEEFFRPNPASHGSYFSNWTTADEVYWKENYRIWMAALREFDRRGGLIGLGEDAGFIYQMYGFGLLRGMELHQEAGFHPLKVIQQATSNGAKILGQEDKLGRVRAGYRADLLVVNGNPLENLKVLYPVFGAGGIEWTIKDGIPYHVPELMAGIKEIVAHARAERVPSKESP
ncbi:MAG TPA: amidohydrolase family protein [Bryobacteraceae bacterium]|nr:amidohydrolase family protein [Bryobacteraceae bacterium]